MGNILSGDQSLSEDEQRQQQEQQQQQKYSLDKIEYEKYKQYQQSQERQYLQQQHNNVQNNAYATNQSNQSNQSMNQTVSLRQQKPEHIATQFINRPQPSGSNVNSIMNQSHNRNQLHGEMNDRLYKESTTRNYDQRIIPKMQTHRDDTKESTPQTQSNPNSLLSKLQSVNQPQATQVSKQVNQPQLAQAPQQQQMSITINKDILEKIDPFNIMAKEKMNLTQLKEKYKQLTFIHHPDKGGSIENFNTLNQAIISITKLQKYYQNTQTHNSLRNSFTKSAETSKKTSNVNMGKKFSIDKFNKIYNANKLSFRENEGYGTLMGKTSKVREDINIQRLGTGKISNEQFSSAFNNYKKKALGDIEVRQHTLPEPTNINAELNYKLLGENKKNFTNQKSGYTDYKQAHIDNNLINTNGVSTRQFKSVEELESDRSNNMTLTQKDKDMIERSKKKEIEQEEYRKQSLERRDNLMYDNFKKLNQLLL